MGVRVPPFAPSLASLVLALKGVLQLSGYAAARLALRARVPLCRHRYARRPPHHDSLRSFWLLTGVSCSRATPLRGSPFERESLCAGVATLAGRRTTTRFARSGCSRGVSCSRATPLRGSPFERESLCAGVATLAGRRTTTRFARSGCSRGFSCSRATPLRGSPFERESLCAGVATLAGRRTTTRFARSGCSRGFSCSPAAPLPGSPFERQSPGLTVSRRSAARPAEASA